MSFARVRWILGMWTSGSSCTVWVEIPISAGQNPLLMHNMKQLYVLGIRAIYCEKKGWSDLPFFDAQGRTAERCQV